MVKRPTEIKFKDTPYRTRLQQFSLQLTEKLKEAGFELLRYDAIGTNSIYLKLDYGVTGSIRLSDHKGKAKLKYRFNVRTDIEESYVDEDSGQHYYTLDDLESLVWDCMAFRDIRIEAYGQERYDFYMRDNRDRGMSRGGFWRDARRV